MADREIRIRIVGKDQASSEIKKVENSLTSLTEKLSDAQGIVSSFTGGGLRGVSSAMSQLGEILSTTAGKLTLFFGTVAIGAGALAKFAASTARALDEIENLAIGTGLLEEDFEALSIVLGKPAEANYELARAIGQLNRQLGEGEGATSSVATVMGQFGLSIRDAEGNIRPAIDILDDLKNELNQIEDRSERAIIANSAFGRSLRELIPPLLIQKGSLKDNIELAKQLGLVVGDEARDNWDKFDQILAATQDKLDAIGVHYKNLIGIMLGGFIELAEKAFDVNKFLGIRGELLHSHSAEHEKEEHHEEILRQMEEKRVRVEATARAIASGARGAELEHAREMAVEELRMQKFVKETDDVRSRAAATEVARHRAAIEALKELKRLEDERLATLRDFLAQDLALVTSGLTGDELDNARELLDAQFALAAAIKAFPERISDAQDLAQYIAGLKESGKLIRENKQEAQDWLQMHVDLLASGVSDQERAILQDIEAIQLQIKKAVKETDETRASGLAVNLALLRETKKEFEAAAAIEKEMNRSRAAAIESGATGEEFELELKLADLQRQKAAAIEKNTEESTKQVELLSLDILGVQQRLVLIRETKTAEEAYRDARLDAIAAGDEDLETTLDILRAQRAMAIAIRDKNDAEAEFQARLIAGWGEARKQQDRQQQEAERAIKEQEQAWEDMIDSIKDGAGEVFDAMLEDGKSVFENLANFAEGVINSLLRKVFESMVGRLAEALLGAGGVLSRFIDAVSKAMGGKGIPGGGGGAGQQLVSGGLGVGQQLATTGISGVISGGAAETGYLYPGGAEAAARAGGPSLGMGAFIAAEGGKATLIGTLGAAAMSAGIALGVAVAGSFLVGMFNRGEQRRAEERARRAGIQAANQFELPGSIERFGTEDFSVEADLTGRIRGIGRVPAVVVQVENNMIDARHAREAGEVIGDAVSRQILAGSGYLSNNIAWAAGQL